MRKICHVTSVHSYLDGRIFQKECKSLSKEYDVTLVAPNVLDHDENGIHVVGVSLPKSRISRFLSLRRVYKAMVKVDASIYHLHDPELIPLGIIIKRKHVKIVFDSHEDIPTDISLKYYIPYLIRKLISVIYAKYEAKWYRKYDAIVTVSPHIVERIKKVNDNTYLITNYPIFEELGDIREFGKFIGFAGGVKTNWSHQIIASSIKDINVKYLIAGPAQSIRYIDELSSNPKIEYLGIISKKQVYSLLSKCSAGMAVYQHNGYIERGTLGNTKIFEIMMAGIPVIATDFIMWKEIIEKYKCGICVDSNNIEAISNAIKFCLDNPKEAKKMGDNGIQAIKEKYNWSSQEKVLFDMYKSLE